MIGRMKDVLDTIKQHSPSKDRATLVFGVDRPMAVNLVLAGSVGLEISRHGNEQFWFITDDPAAAKPTDPMLHYIVCLKKDIDQPDSRTANLFYARARLSQEKQWFAMALEKAGVRLADVLPHGMGVQYTNAEQWDRTKYLKVDVS